MIFGCVKDEERFAGRVENHCLDDGSWYVEACGPRSLLGQGGFVPLDIWRTTYTKHRGFNVDRTQKFAGMFQQIADDAGGINNAHPARVIADRWFERDVQLGENGQDQAAPFYREVCKAMRGEFDVDTGPSFSNHTPGTMSYTTSLFLYEDCKFQEGFELCTAPGVQNVLDSVHEVKNCLFDMPTCRRERERCKGQCGGNESSVLADFITYAAKSEVSTRVLGTERLQRGRANCTTHDHIFEIPLFDGLSEAFTRYASRLRVRGGFNAIDPRACKRQPAACGAVAKVLEKDPTLTFINGRFVAAHELTPPAPPPPPGPPPRYNLFTRPMPSPFPPAPSPPPPWYRQRNAETCVPLITSAEADIDTADGLDRAVCLYVRSVQDERVRAEKCFAPITPSPPPPPPVPQSWFAAMASRGLANRVHTGGTNRAEPASDLSSRAQYISQAQAKQREQLAFLEGLAEDNHQLKDAFSGIQERIAGRRLWQRDYEHRSHDFDENVLRTVAFGGLPIAGVDIAECQALCEAMANATSGSECKAIAYARLNSDPRYVSLLEPTTPSFTHAHIYTMGQTTLGRGPPFNQLPSTFGSS